MMSQLLPIVPLALFVLLFRFARRRAHLLSGLVSRVLSR